MVRRRRFRLRGGRGGGGGGDSVFFLEIVVNVFGELPAQLLQSGLAFQLAHFSFDGVAEIAGHAAQFGHEFAERPRGLGQFFRTEDDQSNQGQDDQVRNAHSVPEPVWNRWKTRRAIRPSRYMGRAFELMIEEAFGTVK